MACKCSPCLLQLRSEMNQHKPGWTYLGCCGDQAHSKRKSDHNPDASGYAHAIDLGESRHVPSMQWLVDKIMERPDLYPQVKYMIYEGHIYYPRDGARKRGKYTYTGPNPHATHLHVSIHSSYTHDRRSWHLAGSGSTPQPTPQPEPAPVPKRRCRQEVDEMERPARKRPEKVNERTCWDTEALAHGTNWNLDGVEAVVHSVLCVRPRTPVPAKATVYWPNAVVTVDVPWGGARWTVPADGAIAVVDESDSDLVVHVEQVILPR